MTRWNSKRIFVILFTFSMLLLPFRSAAAFAVRRIGVTFPHHHQKTATTTAYTVQRTVLLSTATSNTASSNGASTPSPPPIPITLLSGFLGTGKTSALQHLLSNKEDLKIGVIVNDFAEVNIDSKLLQASSSDSEADAAHATDIIELKNGCACCSLSDELFFSVEKLVAGGRSLDAIVVELSGVADPAAVMYQWQSSVPPAVQKQANISRVVTLVDAGTFGTDYMTWDMVGERENWVAPGDDCTGNRKVSELLAEQVEAAHLVLVNKVDLAEASETTVATAVAKALNEKADIRPVEYGRIDSNLVIGQHTKDLDPQKDTQSSSSDCRNPDCTDATHSHSHAHDHHSCDDDPRDTTTTTIQPSASAEVCEDTDCTDTTHSHSHHDHPRTRLTTTQDLGISNFVYKADMPFHPGRLMKILNQWPVAIKDVLDVGILETAYKQEYEAGGKPLLEDSPFIGVIRSKGFCWFAPRKWAGANEDAWRHDTAMYWSHAGRHFGVSTAGKWWAALPDRKMKHYFVDNVAEYDRIKREDFKTEEFGDRRQEIVFIGTKLKQHEITAVLNSCLFTNREMDEYRQKHRNYMDAVFSAPASFSTGVAPSGGLFNVGGVDHTNL